MKEMNALEKAFTERFVPTTAVLALVVATGLGMMFALVTTPQDAAAAVQAVVAALAVLIGACWALNRYFVNRVDAVQLRVDAIVDCVPAGSFAGTDRGLLLVRVDIVNSGKVLIRELKQALHVQTVRPGEKDAIQKHLLRVPEEGELSGRIEPGSWSAINFSHPIGPEVRAVWLYLEMAMGTRKWTWHRTFRLPLEAGSSTTAQSTSPSASPPA